MLASLLKNKPRTVLGVDISPSSIKIVELSQSGNGYKLESIGLARLPDKSVIDNIIQLPSAVGESVEKALKLSGSRLKQAAVAVSGSTVITKIIQMDATLSEKEMESQIAVEADQYIPYSLDEVAIDFEVQHLNKKNPEQAEVLVAACKQENIELREESLEIGGLNTAIVDVEVFAIERAYRLVHSQLTSKPDSSMIAVVDIGSQSTALHVFSQQQDEKNSEIIYTREEPLGSQQLTDEIQHTYDMPAEDAEKAKKNGQLPEDYHDRLLLPFTESLAQQISRSLQFFYSSVNVSSIDGIILCGGGALLTPLTEQASQLLNIPIVKANPFHNMALSRKINAHSLEQEAPLFMTACGLAMRSFN
ncbi:Cell division protein FtsA [invertebrate metagenome]|uniref:Cell division protein FtsA n=1 Tax=invertebrate metagenome TaxID=1711999 RepID=A0A2H9T976_9ZZZZ